MNRRSAGTPAAAVHAPAGRTHRCPAVEYGRTCSARPHRVTSRPGKHPEHRRSPRRKPKPTRRATAVAALSAQVLRCNQPSIRSRFRLAHAQSYANGRSAAGIVAVASARQRQESQRRPHGQGQLQQARQRLVDLDSRRHTRAPPVQACSPPTWPGGRCLQRPGPWRQPWRGLPCPPGRPARH